MDILWVGLGISVVVGFVFYVLATYWQRLLKHHSHAIRMLSQRVEALEVMDDPRLQRRLDDSVPSPLEQVYIFSFRLAERFWEDTFGASKEQMHYLREHGKFLGCAKIERWRSHIAITLSELLPQNQFALWQTRTVDIYPSKDAPASTKLWELHLDSPSNSLSQEVPPSLELRFEDEELVLRARYSRPLLGGKQERPTERVIFQVPLDGDRLACFRVSENSDKDSLHTEASEENLLHGAPPSDSWVSFYRSQGEQRSVDWQLCIRDLVRKAKWERWNIVEPWQSQRVG